MIEKRVEAWTYDGLLFKTREEVLTYKARKSLEEAFRSTEMSIYDTRFFKILNNPRKAYEALKSVYG